MHKYVDTSVMREETITIRTATCPHCDTAVYEGDIYCAMCGEHLNWVKPIHFAPPTCDGCDFIKDFPACEKCKKPITRQEAEAALEKEKSNE